MSFSFSASLLLTLRTRDMPKKQQNSVNQLFPYFVQLLPPMSPPEEASTENRPAKVTKRKSSTKLSKPGTPDPVLGRKHIDIQVGRLDECISVNSYYYYKGSKSTLLACTSTSLRWHHHFK